MSDTPDILPTAEMREIALREREIALRERAMVIEERRVENDRRAGRTPEEAAFDVAIRHATTLADSPVLFFDDSRCEKLGYPAYRNERIAFAVQLLAFAQAMDVPLALLAGQAHIVKGRVGFSTSFLVGLVNARAGLREAIDWALEGQGSALKVTASAVDAAGKRREVTITMEQAKAWGWGATAPWKADPGLMLRYRAAAQLIRLYFSAAVFGLPLLSVEELRDLPANTIEGTAERVPFPSPPRLDVTPTAAPPPIIDSTPTRQQAEPDYRADQD